ncbi:lysine biosynthesis protein LysW [Patescibacteria group bacterium]|nr:lysine biosynthesis protein LysW [Patescibacteria group bacterium]
MKNRQQVSCPECDASIILSSNLDQGEILTCSDCSVELEVREINPVKLEMAPAEEEDWGE